MGTDEALEGVGIHLANGLARKGGSECRNRGTSEIRRCNGRRIESGVWDTRSGEQRAFPGGPGQGFEVSGRGMRVALATEGRFCRQGQGGLQRQSEEQGIWRTKARKTQGNEKGGKPVSRVEMTAKTARIPEKAQHSAPA